MIKWIFGMMLFVFAWACFGQSDITPIESNQAVASLFEIVSKLLVGKPTLSIVVLVVTQVIVTILRTQWLDNAVGKIKMPVITGVAILIPACTFFIANPSASFAQLFSDSATLAALQVFGHQLYLHVIGDKKDTVSSIKS